MQKKNCALIKKCQIRFLLISYFNFRLKNHFNFDLKINRIWECFLFNLSFQQQHPVNWLINIPSWIGRNWVAIRHFSCPNYGDMLLCRRRDLKRHNLRQFTMPFQLYAFRNSCQTNIRLFISAFLIALTCPLYVTIKISISDCPNIVPSQKNLITF